MNLGSIRRPSGSRRPRKRLGRGRGSRQDKSCGRGQKGQKYREQSPLRLEGLQNPIYRRLPHLRGKTNRAMNIGIFRKEFAIVNVAQLERFEANTEVTPELLKAAGLVKQMRHGVKVLGNGDLSQPLTVKAHAVSTTAREKIEAAGGTVQVIG